MAKLPNEAKVWSEPLEGTGLFVNLVVDYPERMAYVTHDLVQDSGRPGSRWLEVALDNLAARTPEGGFHLIDEDSGLRICSVADAYDSSRALLLDRLLPETAAEGCFVSLPGRDALFVLPVSAKALSQVHLLKVLAEKNHQTAPYPISADVFWVRGGVWRQFPIVIKGEEITIEPPEEFLALLDRLVPEKDSSGPDQTSEA
jgi:hypothetical protein